MLILSKSNYLGGFHDDGNTIHMATRSQPFFDLWHNPYQTSIDHLKSGYSQLFTLRIYMLHVYCQDNSVTMTCEQMTKDGDGK